MVSASAAQGGAGVGLGPTATSVGLGAAVSGGGVTKTVIGVGWTTGWGVMTTVIGVGGGACVPGAAVGAAAEQAPKTMETIASRAIIRWLRIRLLRGGSASCRSTPSHRSATRGLRW